MRRRGKKSPSTRASRSLLIENESHIEMASSLDRPHLGVSILVALHPVRLVRVSTTLRAEHSPPGVTDTGTHAPSSFREQSCIQPLEGLRDSRSRSISTQLTLAYPSDHGTRAEAEVSSVGRSPGSSLSKRLRVPIKWVAK